MNIIQDLKKFIVQLVENSYFHTKIYNPKDISDPIVEAIQSKENAEVVSVSNLDEISDPIVSKLRDVQTAIESKEEIDLTPRLEELGQVITEAIKNLDTQVVVKNDLSQLATLFKSSRDTKAVTSLLKQVRDKIPYVSERIDYTLLFEEVITNLERLKNIDLTGIEESLSKPVNLPSGLIDEDRIKVVLSDDQVKKLKGNGGGGYVSLSDVKLDDKNGNLINPATSEKQDDIITAINGISGGTTYNYVQSETGATYKYFGYASSDGWKIKRKTLLTGVWEQASGTGDYETAWSQKSLKDYNYA